MTTTTRPAASGTRTRRLRPGVRDDSGAGVRVSEQPELQPRPLRAGPLDAQPADGERRRPRWTSRTSRPSRSRRSAPWLPNRNVSLRRGEERAELEGHQSARCPSAYDLFGNGKTALKASASRGVEQDSIALRGRQQPGDDRSTQTARAGPTRRRCRAESWRLRSPMRPHDRRRQWRVRPVADAGLRQRQFRAPLRHGDHEWLGRAAVQLGVLGRRAAGSGCRASRSASATSAASTATSRSPTTRR